jgi:cell division septation protein DedD
MAAPRDPFGRDNLDEDREILDIIPERFDADPDSRHARRAAHTRMILTVSLAVLAVMALGVAARHILFGETLKDHQLSVPVIHADDKPLKVKPQDRGGMDVPNQDKLIYDRMAAKTGDQQPERLLPPPEAAQTPPAPESAPAPGPAAAAPAPTPSITAPTPAMTAPASAMTAPLPPLAANRNDAPKTAQSPAASAPMPAPVPAKPQAQSQSQPPAQQPVAKPAPAPAPTATAAAAKAGGGWVVQLGSLGSEAEAKNEWVRIKGAHHELADLSPDIQRVDLGAKGVHWRVRGGSLDEAQARILCAELSKQGQGCLVARK